MKKRKDTSKSAKAATANEATENAKGTSKTTVKLADFFENPENPSTATDEEIQRLAGKLKRVPLGLTAMRIAYVTDRSDGDLAGKKVVISGNKRLRCLKAAFGDDGEVPAEWFADVTAMSEAERHEFIVSANVSDGSWDVDKLLAQYDRAELGELMGAEAVDALLKDVVIDCDEFGTEFDLPNSGKAEFGTITFTVSEKQRDFINGCIDVAKYCDLFFDVEGCENENGAALWLICREWFSSFKLTENDAQTIEKDYKELRAYLQSALKASGKKAVDIDRVLGTKGMGGHYFGESQWMFPTQEAYEKLKTIMQLDRDYKECKLKEIAYNRMKKIWKCYGKM